MVVIVVVQGCGRPNQRTRSRTRLCLRYLKAVNFVFLSEHCVVDPLAECLSNEKEKLPDEIASYLTA